jgi:hypothetical protein
MKNTQNRRVRIIVGLFAAVACGSVFSAPANQIKYERKMSGRTLVELVGEGVDVVGDTASLVSKAQSCAVRNFPSGAVSSSGALNAFTGKANTANASGNLIELSDPAGGQLILNVQIPFSYMLTGRIVKAKVIVETKTDKFRMSATSPAILYSGKSSDASELVVATGTGGEQAIEALRLAMGKVSACIAAEEKKKDW